jgi:hypothetical protein
MEVAGKEHRRIMKPGWNPNGGIGFKQTPSYAVHRRLCAHEITTRHMEGRSIVIRESILPPQVLATSHYSPLTIATKLNKKHRVCHHLSKSFSSTMDNSYNTGVDMDKHRQVYPYDKLPTLTDLCELFAQTRDIYPTAGRLDGGASDVRSAYNQFILQTDKCLLKVTRVESLDEPNTPLLVISLVGVFGDKGTGDVFTRAYSLLIVTLHNTLSAIMHLQTEFGSVRRRSLMYMDDLISAAPPLTVELTTVDTSW